MGGIGVVEQRREPGLAQEALHDDVASTQLAVQDLDDRFASQQRLRAAVHGSEAAFADQLTNDVLSQCPPGEIAWL
jgi:hypothetical protein